MSSEKRSYAFEIQPKSAEQVEQKEEQPDENQEEQKKEAFNPAVFDWSIQTHEPLDVLKIYQRMFPQLKDTVK